MLKMHINHLLVMIILKTGGACQWGRLLVECGVWIEQIYLADNYGQG